MTQISTLTDCLTGIATCTVAEEIKIARVMEDKVIYCGECDNFLYEDTDGYGICGKTNMECRCSDKCRLVPKKNFANFDLCCNEQCPKAAECKRYITYKQDRRLFNYVMKGCIDGTLFIKS